ncbi:hypothetical protein AAMO2058_000907600 [Amorphochlora amoebiformis]
MRWVRGRSANEGKKLIDPVVVRSESKDKIRMARATYIVRAATDQNETCDLPKTSVTTWNPTNRPTQRTKYFFSVLLKYIKCWVWTTKRPTGRPTRRPTSRTLKPTRRPTQRTTKPTPEMTPSLAPTPLPTVIPSVSPSIIPTTAPSIIPTGTPSAAPSTIPSSNPTGIPTGSPSSNPVTRVT